MRIDRVELTNFRCFESLSFDLNPHFTLFIGDNGSGKTTVMDALAMASSIWLRANPDMGISFRFRNPESADTRHVATEKAGETVFVRTATAEVAAYGIVGGLPYEWSQSQDIFDRPDVLNAIERIYAIDQNDDILLPVLAYYNAYRGGGNYEQSEVARGPSLRYAALYKCLDGDLRVADVDAWLMKEAAGRNGDGKWSSAYRAVETAVFACIPGSSGLAFNKSWNEFALNIDGNIQPLSALSAGQRMMFAMVADIAIKCVTQNAYLLNDENPYKAIEETPGIVLIDELDVHLHPKWQRGVAASLKKAFPKIQFVCTSHSPQIIGELHTDEIRILEEGKVFSPPRSFGLDSNRVLEIIQDAEPRNKDVKDKLATIFDAIDSNDFEQARKILATLEAELGEDDPELSAAKSTMAFLESE